MPRRTIPHTTPSAAAAIAASILAAAAIAPAALAQQTRTVERSISINTAPASTPDPANAARTEVRVVIIKDGNRIEFSNIDGTPRYILNGQPQGKGRWRQTPDGGITLLGTDDQPVATFTPEEARAFNFFGATTPQTARFPATPLPPTPPLPPLDTTIAQPRVMLGITMSTPPEALASQLGIDPDRAIVVTAVAPGSSADRAGIRPQDVLLWIGDESTPATFDAVRAMLADKEPGQTIAAQGLRAGEPMRFQITLMPRPEPQQVVEFGNASRGPANVLPRPRLRDEVIAALEQEITIINQRLAESGASLAARAASIQQATGKAREELAAALAELSSEIAQLSARHSELAARMAERIAERAGEQATTVFGLDSRDPNFTIHRLQLDDQVIVLPDGQLLWNFMNEPGNHHTPDQLQSALREPITRYFDRLTRTLDERLERLDAAPNASPHAAHDQRLTETIQRVEQLQRAMDERQRALDQRLDRIERMLEQIAERR